MFFDSFSGFLEMGKHGLYVWSCYGLAAVIVAVNFISPILTRKKVIKDIQRQNRREQN